MIRFRYSLVYLGISYVDSPENSYFHIHTKKPQQNATAFRTIFLVSSYIKPLQQQEQVKSLVQ